MRAQLIVLTFAALTAGANAQAFNPFELQDSTVLLGSSVEAAFDHRTENTTRPLSETETLSKILPRDEPGVLYAFSLAEGGGGLITTPAEAFLEAHVHNETKIDEPGLDEARAISVAEVRINFTLTERSRLTLDSIYSAVGSPGPNSVYNGSIVIQRVSGSTFSDEVRRQFSSLADESFQLVTDELAPGTYRLAAGARADSFMGVGEESDQTIDFSTKVTAEAVPEPCSLAALSLGGLALIRRRRHVRS